MEGAKLTISFRYITRLCVSVTPKITSTRRTKSVDKGSARKRGGALGKELIIVISGCSGMNLVGAQSKGIKCKLGQHGYYRAHHLTTANIATVSRDTANCAALMQTRHV